MVTRVERRLELYTHINISHQEDVQILRYSDGEKCAPVPCSCAGDASLPTALTWFADLLQLHEGPHGYGLVT